jgi:hypothetical protein
MNEVTAQQSAGSAENYIGHVLRRTLQWRSAVLLALLAWTGAALAQTTTLDFDPPSFTAGSALGTVGEVTFLDAPVVFNSTATTTFSPPNALHSAQDCNDDGPCSNGAYMLRMNFSGPMASISLRSGSYGTNQFCFPENDLCTINARLIAYDAAQPNIIGSPQGTAVADTGDIKIGDVIAGPISTELTVSDPCGHIRSAILFVGKGIISAPDGGPARAQIDHLIYSAAPSGAGGCGASGAPEVVINTPAVGQSFSYPYQIQLSGTVTAPAGLFAFCYTINDPMQPLEGDCNQRSVVSSTGAFSVPLQLTQLRAGANRVADIAYDLAGRAASAAVSFTLAAPPPPTISIVDPSANELFKSAAVSEVGEILAPGGLGGFCTGANEASPPPMSQCIQASAVSFFPTSGQGFFSSVPVPAAQLSSGANTIDAYVYDRFGQLGQAHVSAVLPAHPRIVGMEVTQGIQTMAIPANVPGIPVRYSGARLFFGGKTVVRVFANTPDGTLPNVPAYLWAQQGHKVLGVALPSNGELTLMPGGSSVTSAQRSDPNGGYVFTLPWTFDTQDICAPYDSCISPLNGPVTLTAVLFPSADYPPTSTCSGCDSSSIMTLTNVDFEPTVSVIISPVAITWMGSDGVMHAPNSDPTAIFAALGNIFPPGPGGLSVRPYIGTMDVSDLLTQAASQGKDLNWMRGAALGRMGGFGGSNTPGLLVGVVDETGSPLDINGIPILDLGLTNLTVSGSRTGYSSVTSQTRPLTAVAHEVFHQFAYYHAGTSCRVNSVFPAQHWPPDERGDIQGIGLDRSATQANGTYKILTPGAPDMLSTNGLDGVQSCPNSPRTELFDFMSYCACPDESDSWTSIPNWDAWGSSFPSGVIPCGLEGCAYAVVSSGSAPAQSQTTSISASIDARGAVTIESIKPGDGVHLGTPSNPADQTHYNFVVRDSAGTVVSRTHVTPIVSHEHIQLSAEVLSTHGSRIEVERDGSVVASRDRSAHPPVLSIAGPKGGTRLSGQVASTLKWNASDADGDPLSVSVEYSRDDGKTYRTLSTGLAGDHVSLAPSFFGRTDKGRIRLRVNDGFNESVVVSDRISAEGTAPVPHIQEPVEGMHFRSDVELRLLGNAFSGSGEPLRPKDFKWFDGERYVGRGSQIRLSAHRGGLHTIRLLVRDEGRNAEASVRIFLDAVAPSFVGLKVPDVVDHEREEIHIRVAASLPAVLVVNDRGYEVGRAAKDIRLPIPKGYDDYHLPLTLVADGQSRTVVAHIHRN